MRFQCSVFLLPVFLWLHEELINVHVLDPTHFRWVSSYGLPLIFLNSLFLSIFLHLLGHLLHTIFWWAPAWKHTIGTWFYHVTKYRGTKEVPWLKEVTAERSFIFGPQTLLNISDRTLILVKVRKQIASKWAFPMLILPNTNICLSCLLHALFFK